MPRKIGSPTWLRSLMKKFLIPLSAVCRDHRLDYFYWISFVFFSLTFFRFEFNIWKFPPPFICGCLLQAASFRFRFKHLLSRRKIPEHIRLSGNQIFAYLQMCVFFCQYLLRCKKFLIEQYQLCRQSISYICTHFQPESLFIVHCLLFTIHCSLGSLAVHFKVIYTIPIVRGEA